MAEEKPLAHRLFVEGFYEARSEHAAIAAKDIRAAGKPTIKNPTGEDEVWWLANGPGMVQNWIDWRKSSGWNIWIAPDGRPGIELELNPKFGSVPVKMFIDRIMTHPETRVPIVVDLKSGRRTPVSDFQLAFYAAGIKQVFGVDVSHGAYWMARTGELTPVVPIERLNLNVLSHWVEKFALARENEIYLPNVTELCRSCGVNKYCYAYGGKNRDRDPDSVVASGVIPF